jgi:hypothetical protein
VDRLGRWSGEQWKEISPYLDQALDLEAGDRDRWLNELHSLNPQLAEDLRELLATHQAIDAAQFLERSLLGPGTRPLAGQRFGAYTLDSLLGTGGMGSVWLAKRSDGHFESTVAIKILEASVRKARSRFGTRRACWRGNLTRISRGSLMPASARRASRSWSSNTSRAPPSMNTATAGRFRWRKDWRCSSR